VSRPDLQAPPESSAFPRPPSPPSPPAAAVAPAAPAAPAIATPPTPDAAAVAGTADAADAGDGDRPSELQIARLEGRVAALEAALERRSQELRLLQRHLCSIDLAQLARLTAGLPPLPRIACEPGFWRETRDLTEADVPETMEALWSSLHPPGPAGPPAPAALPQEPPVPMLQEPPPVPPVPDNPPGTPPPLRTAAP
jgi:hypothetical protein